MRWGGGGRAFLKKENIRGNWLGAWTVFRGLNEKDGGGGKVDIPMHTMWYCINP